MADCNETLRELEAFLDDELTDDTRIHIRAHLEGCLDCLQAFDFHAELRTVVARKCGNDELPAGLLDRIVACFGDELTGPPAADDAADDAAEDAAEVGDGSAGADAGC